MAKKRSTKNTTLKKQRAQERFLVAFLEAGTVSVAADAAGVDRTRPYAWRNEDPIFASKFEAAEKAVGDMLHSEAIRRATKGVQRLKFHEGKALIDPRTGSFYVENEMSDACLIFLLKGHKPEMFRDKVEHTHKESELPAERLASLIERLKKIL